jgi:hypothetical protein
MADMHALGILYASLAQAMAVATGKPIPELSNYFMRSMAEDAPPETQELCAFLADCVDTAP